MPARRSSGRWLAGADGAWFLGTGNDGKVIRVDRNGQELGVLRQQRNGGARARAGAERRPVRRHVARWPHLSRRCQGTGDTRSSIPTTSTSGRSPSIATATCSPAPATRASSTRSRPDGKGRSSSRRRPRMPIVAGVRSEAAAAGRHGARRAACSASTAPGKGFLLLDTAYQEIHAIRVDPKGMIYVAAQSARVARRQRALTEASVVARRRSTPSIPNVSPEITSIAVVDPVPAIRSSGTAADRRAPTGAVYRVQPDGLWDELWSSKDDAPYDMAIEPDGAVLVATGAKGQVVPAERRSGEAVAADARPRATGDDDLRTAPTNVHHDGESRTVDRRSPSNRADPRQVMNPT